MEKDKIIENIIEIVKKLHLVARKENPTDLNNLFEDYTVILEKKEKLSLELTENLKLIMPIDNNGSITELMTYLYSVKKFNIEIVNEILKENNYEENLIKFVYQLDDMINDDKTLVGMSKNILEILFETNVISYKPFLKKFDENIRYRFINYINKMFLSDKDNFSYQCISKTIENLTEVMGGVDGLNTACYIVPSVCLKNGDSSSLGVAEEEIIYLNEKLIEDYYNKANLSVFRTLFHELAHVNQNRRHEGLLPIVPQVDLKQMKEMVIRKAYPEYYNLNYDIISCEKEANILGIVCAERYFNSLGFSINSDRINKEIEEEIKKQASELRTLGGNLYTLEELFLKVINERRELFDKFSVLGFLYKEENGIIVGLTKEEIKHNFEVKKHNREIFNSISYDPNFEALNYMANGGNGVKNK